MNQMTAVERQALLEKSAQLEARGRAMVDLAPLLMISVILYIPYIDSETTQWQWSLFFAMVQFAAGVILTFWGESVSSHGISLGVKVGKYGPDIYL
jgi:hypothetical protein